MQLSYFKEVEKSLRQKLGDVEAKKMLMRAVYLFSMGGNDYFSFSSKYPNASQSYQQEYVGIVIGNLTEVLKVGLYILLLIPGSTYITTI